LAVADFAFGTDKLFRLPGGSKAFGAECAVLARNNRDRYERAQKLMRRVIQMAHQRGIRVGLGFEFGILPPEYNSLMPQAFIPGTGLPDPANPAVIEVYRATLDGILRDYPDLDWLWLWLHEHTMFVGQARPGPAFEALLKRDGPLFMEAKTDVDRFNGVWSLAFIREGHEYLARRAPRLRMAISGWGGGTQLPGTLRALDRALPTNIVFTCLNPGQGSEPQAPVMAEIAAHREVWAIPWLEGDSQLWHLQPRALLLSEQVQRAAQQQLKGVIAIHWRTEETRANLDMFARAAADPSHAPGLQQFYLDVCREQLGPEAAPVVAKLLTRLDREQSLRTASPEYYPYEPGWGRLRPELRAQLSADLEQVKALLPSAANARCRANLQWLADNFEFTLLLDEVGRAIEPASKLKARWLTEKLEPARLKEEAKEARAVFDQAPIEQVFKTYARRVRSKGELGELSSLNQRVWLEYRELKAFLDSAAD
jgi:hypothetical protein